MSEIRIYNTLTSQKEELIPIVPGQIGMYVCGVTVYDHCHIGHARGAMIFDIIRRYLEYRGLNVKYIRNITDVDDKIINRAREEGREPQEIAQKYTEEYNQDMERLGIRSATKEPRATEHMKEIIELIRRLEQKEYAYPVDGDVYFDIRKFTEYGKLSNRDIESMRAGSRVEIDPRKKDPLDFALWKSAKEGEPAWESPWGKGRPGWHIECSAMSMKHLGETFDIHGGGEDLIFPHHENEIAQSEAATGKPFVRYWLHNGFVNINQEKMSKSLKNFFTIKEVLNQYSSEALRLFLLSTHYRSPVNFTDAGLKDADKALERVYNTFRSAEHLLKVSSQEESGERSREKDTPAEQSPGESSLYQRLGCVRSAFENAMNDDFNTAEAIGRLYEAVREINIFMKDHPLLTASQRESLQEMVNLVRELGGILGLFQKSEAKSDLADDDNIVNDLMELILEIRDTCRAKKEWALADQIRSRLQEKGITIEDRKEGPIWKRK
ncbi:MAG: cysteine--tRNA ligase [bacterium]